MSYSSVDETDISESELDEYVDRCYGQLKNAPKKVQYSDKLYRCPYCPGKKKLVYHFKDLIQHASDVEFARLAVELATDGAVNNLFVWPWIGILANVDVECRDGIYLDVSSSRLRNDLAKKGFNPVQDEDFNSEGVFGDLLQKNGDLMTAADVESQVNRKTGQPISNLTNTIDILKPRLDEIENINSEGIGNIESQKAE
ncbi:INVOLVED IN DE NOVO 2 [Olea europaea subsp. europaea]|uniref:INVOLVED IN DE NOVO 2 n=1 Tax=Olea europaea subsp. europaea TaxID=158383 RepID=A0A8S0QCV7_OLEEU|nr:INVOLVED IN DE NOVO 2 [Olea europaea subsp. europaea]